MSQQFSRFLAVGSIGFIVDATILSSLVHLLDHSPYWSRLPSFIIAATFTWYLNYHWAFMNKAPQTKLLSISRYFVIQSAGITTNLIVYSSLLYLSPYFLIHPEYPLAIASVCALVFNYLGLSIWVFKTKKN